MGYDIPIQENMTQDTEATKGTVYSIVVPSVEEVGKRKEVNCKHGSYHDGLNNRLSSPHLSLNV